MPLIMLDVTVVEATHHFFIRVKENLLTDKNSHVHQHLYTFPNCERKCSVQCFVIILNIYITVLRSVTFS